MSSLTGWQGFALASAFFAGLTAILGKLGVEGRAIAPIRHNQPEKTVNFQYFAAPLSTAAEIV